MNSVFFASLLVFHAEVRCTWLDRGFQGGSSPCGGETASWAVPGGCFAFLQGSGSCSDLLHRDPCQKQADQWSLGSKCKHKPLLYSCRCCNDLPLKVSFMIQGNVQHFPLPGDQSMPRQLSEHTEIKTWIGRILPLSYNMSIHWFWHNC